MDRKVAGGIDAPAACSPQTCALPCETTALPVPMRCCRPRDVKHGCTCKALIPFDDSIQPSTPTALAPLLVLARPAVCAMDQCVAARCPGAARRITACLPPAQPGGKQSPQRALSLRVHRPASMAGPGCATDHVPLPAPLHRTGPVIYAQRAGDLVWALRPASSAGPITLRPPASLSYSSTPHSP